MDTLLFFEKSESPIENSFRHKDAEWQANHNTIFYLPLLLGLSPIWTLFYAISRARVVIRSVSSIYHLSININIENDFEQIAQDPLIYPRGDKRYWN